MNRASIRWVPILAFGMGILTLSLILAVFVELPPAPIPFVRISVVANLSNSTGPRTHISLSNEGSASVTLNSFCTIYWTNRFGIETNRFVRYHTDDWVIRPRQSKLVFLDPPDDALTWNTSFSYQRKPSELDQAMENLKVRYLGPQVPDGSFRCSIGPLITNSLLSLRAK